MLETRIDALDFLAQLGEEIVSDYTATDETITTIVTALLAMQVNTTPITLGTIEPTVTRSIEVQAGATILDILSKLRDTVGGYISVNTSRQLDWLNDIGEDKGQQIRYKKNVKGLSRILEFSNFGNRLYLYGEGEGEARIKLSDATDTKVLGTDTIGTANLALNVINYAKFTASAGVVTGIKVYSLVSGNVKVAIFADSSGEPGALIKANNTGQAVTLNQWNTLIIDDIYLAAGDYWLAIISDTTGAISRNAAAGARRYKVAAYAGYTFPSTAGAGFTSTAEEIAISGYYISTEDYIEDTISQAEYGVCIKQLVDKSITHPDTLLSWGIIKLSEMRLPRATYTVDMVNLEAFGWTFESLQLGSIVKVTDEDLGIDIEARIVDVIRDLSNPQNIKVQISNVLKDIIDTMGGVRDTLQFQNHIATKIGAGQVYVLGAFTVIDWVTGGTTNIKGDYVRTGHLESTNWAAGAGSQFDLDAGTFKLGGSAAPKLSWDGVTLIVTGAIYATSGEFTGILKTTTLQAATILTISGTISAGAGAILINTTGFHVACSGITDTWFHIYNGVDDSYIRQQSGILPSLQITSERKIVIQPSGSGLDGNIYLITSGSHSILPSASGEIYLGSATVHFNTIYAHTFAIVSPMKMKFTNAVDSIKAIKTKNIDGIEKLDKDTLPPNIVTKVTKKELEEYDLYFDSLMKYYEGEKTLGHNVEKPVKHDLEDSSVSLNDLIGLLFTGQQEIIKRVEKLEVK